MKGSAKLGVVVRLFLFFFNSQRVVSHTFIIIDELRLKPGPVDKCVTGNACSVVDIRAKVRNEQTIKMSRSGAEMRAR